MQDLLKMFLVAITIQWHCTVAAAHFAKLVIQSSVGLIVLCFGVHVHTSFCGRMVPWKDIQHI